MPSWDKYKHELAEHERELFDIYVDGLTPNDWSTAYEHVVSTYPSTFTWDSEDARLPGSVDEIEERRARQAPRLYIDVDGIDIHWNFFASDDPQLELDFRASLVSDEARFRSLVRFLHSLAIVLAKPARLTLEGSPDLVVFEVQPDQAKAKCEDV